MKIAKPLLMVTTPLGVAWGLLEAYHLAGGLVILMAAMIGLLTAAAACVVAVIRREAAAERKRAETQRPPQALGFFPTDR
jgi:uncharacterized integral membrane protein